MSLAHNYTHYVQALRREQRCTCQQHPIGRCPSCALKLSEKEPESTTDDRQLSFPFAATTSAVYSEET